MNDRDLLDTNPFLRNLCKKDYLSLNMENRHLAEFSYLFSTEGDFKSHFKDGKLLRQLHMFKFSVPFLVVAKSRDRVEAEAAIEAVGEKMPMDIGPTRADAAHSASDDDASSPLPELVRLLIDLHFVLHYACSGWWFPSVQNRKKSWERRLWTSFCSAVFLVILELQRWL